MRPLIMLIPYFGRWPQWIELFIESCKGNPEVHWRIYTDCGEPQNKADNVDYVHLSLREYVALVQSRLGIRCEWTDAYKLCEIKPCLGHIHEADLEGYRFFGYGDIDVIYGNIRAFYTDALLARYNVISTHFERLAGHFAIFRNTEYLRRAYERIPDWQRLIAEPQFNSVAETWFSKVFMRSAKSQGLAPDDPLLRGRLFVERYSTMYSQSGWHDGTMDYPERWFWQQGRLTNDRDGAREFLYLHFMRWQSNRWTSNPPKPGEGAWVGRKFMHVDWHRAAEDGFCISAKGFSPIGRSRDAAVPGGNSRPLQTILNPGRGRAGR